MKRFSDMLAAQHSADSCPEVSVQIRLLFEDICQRLYRFSLYGKGKQAYCAFIKEELDALTEKYESQPVHFTQEFSVFRFMNSVMTTVAEADLSGQLSEKVLYWLLFHAYISCLVQTVRRGDEAEINKVQRAMDRLCTGCSLI